MRRARREETTEAASSDAGPASLHGLLEREHGGYDDTWLFRAAARSPSELSTDGAAADAPSTPSTGSSAAPRPSGPGRSRLTTARSAFVVPGKSPCTAPAAFAGSESVRCASPWRRAST